MYFTVQRNTCTRQALQVKPLRKDKGICALHVHFYCLHERCGVHFPCQTAHSTSHHKVMFAPTDEMSHTPLKSLALAVVASKAEYLFNIGSVNAMDAV